MAAHIHPFVSYADTHRMKPRNLHEKRSDKQFLLVRSTGDHQLGKGVGSKNNDAVNGCVTVRRVSRGEGNGAGNVEVHFPPFISNDSNFASFIPSNLSRCLNI